MMTNTFKQIITKNAPTPVGPYSQGIITDNFVFTAGQRPQEPVIGEIKKDIKEQTKQVIENIQSILKASGNINLDNIREVAETGVDYISLGMLTHSVKAFDISMKNLVLK